MDANSTVVRIAEESSPRVIGADPVFEEMFILNSTLASNPTTVVSNLLTATREVKDVIRTGFEAGGELPTELLYGVADKVLPGFFASSWQRKPVRKKSASGSEITIGATPTGYTLAAASAVGSETENNTGAFFAGALAYASGWATSANNGLKKVTAATATSASVAGLTQEAAPTGARLKVVGFEGAASDIGANAAGLTSATFNFTTTGLKALEWVLVGGTAAATRFAADANNGWCRLASNPTANAMPFDIMPDGWTVEAAAAGKTIRVWVGDYIRNGTTKRTYAAEVAMTDLDVPEWDMYVGLRGDTYSLSGEAESLITASTSYQGSAVYNSTEQGKTTAGGTALYTGTRTDVAASDEEVLNTSSNVGLFYEDGVPLPGENYVLSFRLSIANNPRRTKAVGYTGAPRIGVGRCFVTGELSLVYASNAVRNKVINGTASSWALAVETPARTKARLWDVPRLKYTGGNPTTPGLDQDRTMSVPFQGLQTTTPDGTKFTVQEMRFEYIER